MTRVTHGDGVGGTPRLQARTAPVSSYLETTMQLNLSCTAAKTIWRKLERKQVAYSSGQNRKTTAAPNPTQFQGGKKLKRFRRKTYLMKQFRFVKGSEDSVTKCQFPRIFKLRSELQPASRARKILASEQGSFCGRIHHVTALFLCGTLRWRQSFDVCMASKGLL